MVELEVEAMLAAERRLEVIACTTYTVVIRRELERHAHLDLHTEVRTAMT